MPKRKDRLILDSNLWISFLLTKNFSKLDRLLEEQAVVLLFSKELLEEFIEVAHVVSICRDEKDNFLLALAHDGKATHLLTGDKDLLDIKKYQRTRIQTIASYIDS